MPTRQTQRFTRFTLFIGIAVLVLLATLPASVAVSTASANLKSAPAERLLNPDGTLNTATGYDGVLDLRGWNVALDAERGPLFRPAGSLPAEPTADTWSALGTGTNNAVLAIAVSGDDVYAGGFFNGAGGVAANYIARWNGSVWSPLGTGTNDWVRAIAIKGSDVYAGGFFTSASGVAANFIAKYGAAPTYNLYLPLVLKNY